MSQEALEVLTAPGLQHPRGRRRAVKSGAERDGRAGELAIEALTALNERAAMIAAVSATR